MHTEETGLHFSKEKKTTFHFIFFSRIKEREFSLPILGIWEKKPAIFFNNLMQSLVFAQA